MTLAAKSLRPVATAALLVPELMMLACLTMSGVSAKALAASSAKGLGSEDGPSPPLPEGPGKVELAYIDVEGGKFQSKYGPLEPRPEGPSKGG